MATTRSGVFFFARRIAFHGLLLAFFFACGFCARAALQFDVFVGFDGIVPEASWFPLICEVKNDGPSFTGVIEVSAGQFNTSQKRRVVVELPTGTLKRIVVPVFSTARYSSSWEVRLLDEKEKVRGEQIAQTGTGLIKRQIAAEASLIGAIPRTATGMPILRDTHVNDAEMQPATARLQPTLMPDDPLVLEGMGTIYLNSERALELNDQQVFALLGWLNNGGHLIVGIEQISDINGTPWLRKIIPCELTGVQTVSAHPEIHDWLHGSATPLPASSQVDPATVSGPKPKGRRPNNGFAAKLRNADYNPYSDVARDAAFENAPMQVATGILRDATVLVGSDETPLIITSHEGRGRVTALMFSPERKPFSIWKNLPSFWSKLTEIPTTLYLPEANNNALRGGWSVDGVFGAMIDSKQVRKLPVEWLLLLLIVYLLVIGPIDQYWLKRIKRPMLTWITFPCYVVLFSLLIYFIGYKLRAGESEWNELHMVDVLANGTGAELRGRTYASVYSPVNARYEIEAQEHFSTFRGEFQSSWSGGGQENERADILQTGDNFKAQITVPVWTSQLYVCDWWQSAVMPLKFSVASDGDNWAVTVNNLRDRALSSARLAIGDHIMELGELPANQAKTFLLPKGKGEKLQDFLIRRGTGFQNASQARQQAFGATGGGQIADLPTSAMAVSFISKLETERFVTPPGLDMTPLLDQNNAVLLAWEADYSPIKPLNQFRPRRSSKDTLWRVSVPINAAP